ncbi:hypothetical protein ACLMJK_009206 [Lecanora helva]
MENTPAIWNMPAGIPPPGVIPNFENPVTRVSMINISAAVCLPLIIIFASFRLYARAFIVRRKSWDDLACLLGFIGGCSYISLTLAVVHLGAYGRHEWDYKLGDLTKELIRLTLANEVLYGPFIWFIKVTLLLLFLEIFGQLRWLRWLVYSGMCLTGLFYLSTAIAYLVLCAPKNQTHIELLTAISSTKCQKQGQPLSIVIGSFNLASDLYILCLPLPAVWSLQMAKRRKIGISAIFSSAIAAVISSILTIVFRTRLSRSRDQTWDIVPLWVVTIIEITAGFMVTCMPSMPTVYHHTQARWHQAFSTTLQKLRSRNTSQKTDAIDNSSQVELRQVDSDRSNYKIVDYTHHHV